MFLYLLSLSMALYSVIQQTAIEQLIRFTVLNVQGIGPRVLWIGIGGSIFFGVLESTKRFLSESREKRIESSEKKQA